MSNFSFLKKTKEYDMFSDACLEAEKIFSTSTTLSALASRKAFELAVKWVFSADKSMNMPDNDNIQSLVHESTFKFAVDKRIRKKFKYIIQQGNKAAHQKYKINSFEAMESLHILFEFIQWIDYSYGKDYKTRKFDDSLIPKHISQEEFDNLKKKLEDSEEKDKKIEELLKQVEELSAELTKRKETNQKKRVFETDDISEFETRKLYIDLDLRENGWIFDSDSSSADIYEEYEVNDMEGKPNKKGYIDYVLFGKDGLPLAVIEAKRTSVDPNVGRTQALLYADALERKFKRRPFMFTTNGFETYFWDDLSSPQRHVSGIFSKDDMQKLMNRRSEKLDLNTIKIDDKITDRYYQKEAIRNVCNHIDEGFRKHLLVMATGTGKTRTASSLTDVLSRGKYITNILFLADRTALVKQAKDDFKNYLPNMSLCNLCENKDDKNARIVFSTYPTILNAIDTARNKNGDRLFTAAHFDLIIIDESHRSIFKKYQAIFEYFDAILVGLTATPKTDVDRNTYDFFERENGIPTYAYDYETAVYTDHVLVPYYNYEVKTKFLEKGINYDELSDVDKERFEDDFIEDGNSLPKFIPSEKLNKFVFNENTADIVIQDLMERGIKVEGGDRLGKTIIFAQNKDHAEFILERFNKLYPKYNGLFAQRIICNDTYAQSIIDDFKQPNKNPIIAVSVDMMDTGIDVPECVNLVFFKKVRSKTKFWQMIGRGTRLCKDLTCLDQIDGEYTDKRRFLIFDYCGNFEYFRQNKNGYETKETKTLSENVFGKRIKLISTLQDSCFAEYKYKKWRQELVDICFNQINALSYDLVEVRLKKEFVERYKKQNSLDNITDTAKYELIKNIAPIVTMNDADESAKRFDNFMYGLMLSQIENMPSFKRAKTQLQNIASMLETKSTIPQVSNKLVLIKSINTDDFWNSNDILNFEKVRKALRGLIQFLDDNSKFKTIITNLSDPITTSTEGKRLESGYDFEDYKKKVNRYIYEHENTIAIHKLTHNIPLSIGDYKELERIFTEELGSKEDYEQEFGNTPFGLLVRKVAKLDHEAAMQAFSKFINDQSLNQKQIAFVNKIITHIENNGYMENISDLQKPPFDKPFSFIKLFDIKKRDELKKAIDEVRENAINIIA